MPNKTIYVSDDDLPVYQRAQELAGGNLSAAISEALRRYVELEEGRQEGYEEIIVRVGVGPGRKQRFSGVLLGEWAHYTGQRMDTYRVYRTRKGKFAVHTEHSEEWTTSSGSSDNWIRDLADWRKLLGVGEQGWGSKQSESTLQVVDTLEDLREAIPAELYDMVVDMAEQPPVEDLDI